MTMTKTVVPAWWLCTHRCIVPTPSGLYGDLTYPDVKCPIVGQTECVKSPNTAPHKPQLQHRDLTWLHILKVYAFIKCP